MQLLMRKSQPAGTSQAQGDSQTRRWQYYSSYQLQVYLSRQKLDLPNQKLDLPSQRLPFRNQKLTAKMWCFTSKSKAARDGRKRKKAEEKVQREQAYYETMAMTGGSAVPMTVPFDEAPKWYKDNVKEQTASFSSFPSGGSAKNSTEKK